MSPKPVEQRGIFLWRFVRWSLPSAWYIGRHVEFIQVVDATTSGVFGADCKVEDELEAPLFSSTGLRRMRLCCPRRDSVGYSHFMRRRAHWLRKQLGPRTRHTQQDMSHLHVWSGLWAEGLPQAIFLSLQNRQARACFFCSPVF